MYLIGCHVKICVGIGWVMYASYTKRGIVQVEAW